MQASTVNTINRRRFLMAGVSLGSLSLGGCVTDSATTANLIANVTISDSMRAMYGALPDEQFSVPAVKLAQVDPAYFRNIVNDPTGERPGTIVVDTKSRYLYLVRDNGKALRYGVGIGREGFAWSGRATIAAKREWPKWTPPPAMIEREPELEKWRHGMPPGLENPLGARALYIFQGGRDTLYRIHGTNEAWTIGKAVSSGCVRLLNQDVIDLFDRVPVGTEILVI